MKLLLCPECGDVFKLAVGKMRKCACGKTKGRYINNVEAEVSENAVSIALGNGSVGEAYWKMRSLQKSSNDEATREDYILKARIDFAWIRPNTGAGNPHTKIIKSRNKKV